MKIRCIIIDDEPLAIRVIKKYLESFREIECIASFNNPIDAISTIEEKEINVIFLDINMPLMNGLVFIKTLRNKPHIIITTAYKEYAIESFELDVLDYLLKPIPFERFAKSVGKIINQIKLEKGLVKNSDLKSDFIFFKVNRKLVRIRLEDILYIESMKDYIKVHTTTDAHLVLKSMSAVAEELSGEHFIRIHRSYLIAIDKIKSIEGNLIEIGDKRIPIGRNYTQTVKKRIIKQ